MPIYNPDHVEYEVTSGRIQVALEDGTLLPAYWAHPRMGAVFPGIVLIHDWWGVTPLVRHMTTLFAQVGHYVIAPDFFNGTVAATHDEALKLLESLGAGAYKRADAALSVLEEHHNCNGQVALVGIGMGGSLAYEAAIRRDDLEAAVAYSGFPQRYLSHFERANTPILAFYGSDDPYIANDVVEQLRLELAESPLAPSHEVVLLDGADHEFFDDDLTDDQRDLGSEAWHKTLDFLESILEGPTQPPERKNY